MATYSDIDLMKLNLSTKVMKKEAASVIQYKGPAWKDIMRTDVVKTRQILTNTC